MTENATIIPVTRRNKRRGIQDDPRVGLPRPGPSVKGPNAPSPRSIADRVTRANIVQVGGVLERSPRGEAVHCREHALSLGVPDYVVLAETRATNTGENIALSRRLLDAPGVHPDSVTLVTRPYQQRRAFATARKPWPEVEVICSSLPVALDDYVARLVGDSWRSFGPDLGTRTAAQRRPEWDEERPATERAGGLAAGHSRAGRSA
jgi:hypothetical protein